LVGDAERILARMAVDSDHAGHEAYAAELELRSPPAERVDDAVAALRRLRQTAVAAGATLLGAGVHPTGSYGDAQLVGLDRYRRVDEEMRGLIRRTPECALHIHVGLPDPETAVLAHNGLRRQLPLLLGLAANSPWWFGSDSGLASSRATLVRAYPGRGVPPAFRDIADWHEHVTAILTAGQLDDYTLLWPDVRLHPRLGTVEVRELDVQSCLTHTAALAALVRALAREAVERPVTRHHPSDAIAWSSFRAARDGIEATIFVDGVARRLGEVARETAARVLPLARELGDEDALGELEQILERGGGAGSQRAVVTRSGLAGLLRMLVDETHGTQSRAGPPPFRGRHPRESVSHTSTTNEGGAMADRDQEAEHGRTVHQGGGLVMTGSGVRPRTDDAEMSTNHGGELELAGSGMRPVETAGRQERHGVGREEGDDAHPDERDAQRD
ncbi:MAG: carboxylate-amine ligase, partial [Gaiella sp.]